MLLAESPNAVKKKNSSLRLFAASLSQQAPPLCDWIGEKGANLWKFLWKRGRKRVLGVGGGGGG